MSRYLSGWKPKRKTSLTDLISSPFLPTRALTRMPLLAAGCALSRLVTPKRNGPPVSDGAELAAPGVGAARKVGGPPAAGSPKVAPSGCLLGAGQCMGWVINLSHCM